MDLATDIRTPLLMREDIISTADAYVVPKAQMVLFLQEMHYLRVKLEALHEVFSAPLEPHEVERQEQVADMLEAYFAEAYFAHEGDTGSSAQRTGFARARDSAGRHGSSWSPPRVGSQNSKAPRA